MAEDVKSTKFAKIKTDDQFELTKKHLESQQKVPVFIAYDEREKLDYFYVNINGVIFNVPVGREVEVPRDVATVIRERLESEGKVRATSKEMADHLQTM